MRRAGKRRDVPARHWATAALDAYLEASGLDEPKAPLFQTVEAAGRRLTGRALERRFVLAMVKRRGRRAAALDVLPHVPGDGDHSVPVKRGDAGARSADLLARVTKDYKGVSPGALLAKVAPYSLAELVVDEGPRIPVDSLTDSPPSVNPGGAQKCFPRLGVEPDAAGSPRASGAGVRRFFAPGTPASAAVAPAGSGGLPDAVDELVAPLGRPGRAGGVMAVEVAAVSPAAGDESEASSGCGTAVAGRGVEPDAQPARRGHRRIGRQGDVPADVARANPSTPPPAGTAAARR